jgi:hypothetical protein
MSDPRHEQALRMEADLRPTEELIVLFLSNDMDTDDMDTDDEAFRALCVLHHRLPKILPRVKEFAVSSDPDIRFTAARMMASSLVVEMGLYEACESILTAMLEASPDDSRTTAAVINAFGHIGDKRSLDLVLRYREHASSEVRFQVAFALGGIEEEPAIEALIKLSADEDRDVRDWATFGLGSLVKIDTPQIRDALVARLGEEDDEVRGEALVGLAKRRDSRVIDCLRADLLKPFGPYSGVQECVDMLLDEKESFGNEWSTVYEDLTSRR